MFRWSDFSIARSTRSAGDFRALQLERALRTSAVFVQPEDHPPGFLRDRHGAMSALSGMRELGDDECLRALEHDDGAMPARRFVAVDVLRSDGRHRNHRDNRGT